MANASFNGTELSGLGFSVQSINGREMAPWKPEEEQILGREVRGDLSGRFEPTETRLAGTLSAPLAPWSSHAHPNFLTNLDALKGVLDPELGYGKLVITGDRPTYFRWARYSSMEVEERKPVFKLPFQPVTLTFENYEPYWRVTHADVTVTSTPTTVPNAGHRPALPRFELNVASTIQATAGAVVNPVTLFTIGNVTAQWIGVAGDGALVAGDKLFVDSDTLTVTRKVGANPETDMIRFYTSTGVGSALYGGFPVVVPGGSSLSAKHANISSIVVHYDELYR